MSIEFLACVFFLLPIPHFAKFIMDTSIEYNEKFPIKDQITIRQIKILALIFGVLWPVYVMILIVAIIRVFMNPPSLDE